MKDIRRIDIIIIFNYNYIHSKKKYSNKINKLNC